MAISGAEAQARWRARNPEKARANVRKSMQKLWFGGNREIVVQRDGEQCVSCGMTRAEHKSKYNRDITVDHIDNKGRYSVKKNNKVENLQTLCLPCHGKKDHRRKKEE